MKDIRIERNGKNFVVVVDSEKAFESTLAGCFAYIKTVEIRWERLYGTNMKHHLFHEELEEAKNYEMDQWVKAVHLGTEQGWKNYKRNVNRKLNAIERTYGFKVNRGSFMS